MQSQHKKKRGQSAIEYMILATTITIVALIGFDERRGFLIQARNLAEGMFNEALRGIMGTSSEDAARSPIDQTTLGDPYP